MLYYFTFTKTNNLQIVLFCFQKLILNDVTNKIIEQINICYALRKIDCNYNRYINVKFNTLARINKLELNNNLLLYTYRGIVGPFEGF